MKITTNESSFYNGYQVFKGYTQPQLKPKHIKDFDKHFWHPTNTQKNMSVLEIGCGTGLFLQYLNFKGVTNYTGIDNDPALDNFVHPDVKAQFKITDVFDFLSYQSSKQLFDRIVMFDVLEHFDQLTGNKLLQELAQILEKNGCILVRVPNMSSPWGGQYQFGDLTHQAAYTPGSLRQLAIASGLNCISCYPQIRGNNSRKIMSFIINKILSKTLLEPPEIWSGNFLGILQRKLE